MLLKKLMFLLPVCASVLPGCMSTPPLSEATGAEHSEIMIKDVVQRVKCELSDTFDKKVDQRDFLWLASWTAHADLTLVINDSAGITPSGTYTRYLGTSATAKQTAKGPLASIVDTFSLSASANLNSQAVRTETVSFTIALDELKLWRKHLDKIEANLPPEKRSCNFEPSTGVTGNLGLQEWVDSAFFPVQTGQLQAGIHPFGQAGKSGATQGPKAAAGGPQAKAAETLTKEDIAKKAAEWAKQLADLQAKTKVSFDKIDTAIKNMDTADADLQNKFKVLNDSNYNPVLAPYLKQAYAQSKAFETYLKNHKTYQDNCVAYKTNLASAAALLTQLQAELNKSPDVTGQMKILYGDLSSSMNDISANDYPKQSAACATSLTQAADQAAKNANALPSQIDPPIDSVAHSLQFVVAYGAGISPSWVLLNWPKGVGASLSASGTRTHTLNLALAPRSGGPAIGADALRLINNQVIRSLGN